MKIQINKQSINSFVIATLIAFLVFACKDNDFVITKGKANSQPVKLDKLTALVEEITSLDLQNTVNKDLTQTMPSKWHLNRSDVITTYLGLSIKGSGGGGGFIDGIDIINKIDEIDIYDISTVEDDKLYIVAGGIGAPTALKGKIDEIIIAIEKSVDSLAKIKGKELGGILSVESGSANAVIAMLLSKRLKVPLINADGAGRAVPQLGNLTYAHESYTLAPAVLTSIPKPKVTIKVLEPKDAAEADDLIRNTIETKAFDQMAGLALWAQTGKELKASAIIRNVYSDAYKLGAYTLHAMYQDVKELENYFKQTNSFISSYEGKLTNFVSKETGGFDIITLTVALDDKSILTIKALNENLLLTTSNNEVVTAPNLISFLIQGNDGNYIPFNNGDADVMKSLVGKRIYIVNSFADKQLYTIGDTFLDNLKKAFKYFGPIIPAH